MSALPRPPEAGFAPITPDTLDAVLAIEAQAYTHPWTRGNFLDSLRAGYQARQLVAGGAVIGYFVAMKGVDEVHLLNITVAPACQRQGWARVLLDALRLWARGQGALWLWLEVRTGNLRAQSVYTAHGFQRVGLRKRYYPALDNGREDAVVMSQRL
ncbi:ribosomal protein S18-alanine N-acetyltransferase [Sphingomonas sp. NCPPB 2930]